MGAQQRLVALGIHLELVEQLIDRDPGEARRKLHEVRSELDGALEEIRSLASGVYPSLLADSGLPEALRAVALKLYRCPCRRPRSRPLLPGGGARRLLLLSRSRAECREARPRGASAHDPGRRRRRAQIRGSRRRRGLRSPDPARRGCRARRHRLDAVGGTLEIHSAPGEGTVVVGRVPHRSRRSARPPIGAKGLQRTP